MKVIPFNVAESIISQGIVFSDDIGESGELKEIDIYNVYKYADLVNKVTIHFYDLNIFSPVVLGLSCIIVARKLSHFKNEWNHKFLQMTTLNFQKIENCFNTLYK